MADNVSITAGAGTSVASDDISGVQHQRVKIGHGADGSATDVSHASPMPVDDFGLSVARGLVTGIGSVRKFGKTDNADNGVDTDVWDGASIGTPVLEFVAPTQARIHQIASTSASDDSVGVGARTIQVYGLKTWDTAESSETVIMDGTSDVATANSYVIIHRMKVLTKGATNVNVGIITATPDTDPSVTAHILAGQGQTQMAIYGIPSTQTGYITSYYASAVKASASLSVSVDLLYNPEPDTELTNFRVIHTIGIATEGSSYLRHEHGKVPQAVAGPCILKIRANSSANDTTVAAGFDAYVVDN